MVSSTAPRGGRRPGATSTREAILAAARAAFFERSYAGATIRGIAAAAAVDPALVLHYFGNKRGLFAAAMDLPFDPGDVVAAALAAPARERGIALARAALSAWEAPGSGEVLIGLMRSAVSDEASAARLREFLTEAVLAPIAAALEGPNAMLAASLAMSHLMGVLFARHIARVGPLADAPLAGLIPLLGAGLQQYFDAAPEAPA
ncbi:MAG: TetR family transcriptional regulator [Dehalococcoidia bacterium]